MEIAWKQLDSTGSVEVKLEVSEDSQNLNLGNIPIEEIDNPNIDLDSGESDEVEIGKHFFSSVALCSIWQKRNGPFSEIHYYVQPKFS